MTEISKIGQTPNVQKPEQQDSNGMLPKLPQKGLEIREGMRVADVQANGTEAQKLIAAAFDEPTDVDSKGNLIGKDGVFDAKEAEFFNNYRFDLNKNKKEFTAYNTKTGCAVMIKYNSLEELKDKNNMYMLYRMIKDSRDFKGGGVVYDYRNNQVSLDGVSGSCFDIPSYPRHTTLKNCDLKLINATFCGEGCNLNIVNTKDVGMIWDSPVQVNVTNGQEPTINADSQSKIEIRRFEK